MAWKMAMAWKMIKAWEMIKQRKIVLAVLLMGSASTQFAQAQWFIAPQLAMTRVDTSESASDFDNVASINLQGGYRINDWLAITGGVLLLGDSEESGETDAGSYDLTLSTAALHAGVQGLLPLTSLMTLTFDAGLDVASVDLELEENFFGIKPGGSDSIDDKVLGYHAGLGLRFQWDNFGVGPVLRYQHYPNLFKGDSDYPFDLKLTSLGVEFFWQL